METTSFAIEHEKTRHSLQNAFEGLFSKYGREFASDDEIDILDLRVVKKGRTLEGMRPLEFGEAFHKKRKRKNRHRHRLLKEEKRQKRNKSRKLEKPRKRQQRKEAGEDMDRKIYESIRGINNRIVEAWPERDFETFFRHIYNNERDTLRQRWACHCGKRSCFDCIFTKI